MCVRDMSPRFARPLSRSASHVKAECAAHEAMLAIQTPDSESVIISFESFTVSLL